MATSTPESHPLLVESRGSDAAPTIPQGQGRNLAKMAGVAALGLGAVFGVASLLPSHHVNKTYAALQERMGAGAGAVRGAAKLDSSVVYLQALGDYGQVNAEHYPWVQGRKIVEPYKGTTLSLTNLDEDIEDEASLYVWTIAMEGVGEELASPVTYNKAKNEAVHSFANPGTYMVSVEVLNSMGDKILSFNTGVLCRYVKRELRTLSDNDRELFTTAASELWKYNQTEGQKKYGNSFTSIDEFVLEHAFSSTGDVNCDHWHEGTGFMAHHFALTVAFEESVRAVNPAVTIPYWDFTIEGETISQAGGGPSMLADVSPFFNDDWFGAVDEDYHITNSKWAHSKVVMISDVEKMINGRTTKHLTNSYGVVTAPWNNNNDQEVARVMSGVCGQEPTNKQIPDCSAHHMLVNTTDLDQFMLLLPGVGHGPMHVNTGGVFGQCEDQFETFYDTYHDYLMKNVTIGPSETVMDDDFVIPDESDYDDREPVVDYTVFTKKELFREKIHLEFFHMYRMLWRSQTCARDGQALNLQCPESCDLETDQSECLCTCTGALDDNGDAAADFDWENIEPCMYASNKTKTLMHDILSTEMREDMARMICTAGAKEGQQLESASPLDIVFWMIHPVLDRLATAKRLATAGAKIPFGTAMGNVAGFATEDWLEYSYYSTDDFKCPGHGKNDLVLSGIPMLEWIERSVPGGNSNMTNWDFYAATDPAEFESVDYIYDGFTWDHCSAR